MPRTRIERIAREEKPVTADTALRLGKFFKTGAAFWMNIQARFDLETAADALAPQIKEDRVLRGGMRAMLSADRNCGALDRTCLVRCHRNPYALSPQFGGLGRLPGFCVSALGRLPGAYPGAARTPELTKP